MVKKVSIGIPVYNEIKFIKHTLNSVVEQDADEIVISDNASTDGSSEICKEYAAKYAHINYVRLDKSISATENFLNCITLARHEYFMLMGGHDLLSKNYVSELRKYLDKTSCVLAYTNAVHLSEYYAFKHIYEYNFAHLLSDENASTRVLATIEKLSNCSLYYGLYKKDVFMQAYLKTTQMPYIGIDHALLSQVAAYGRMLLCPKATFYRIDPNRQEPTPFESWERVLKAIYADKYNPKEHVPELIPSGILLSQFVIAQSVAFEAENSNEYLEHVIKILLKRFILNQKTVELVVPELCKLAEQYGIAMDVIAKYFREFKGY